MFGIGFGEILVIALVAFLVVGPKDLPQMAKQFGKWFVKFRRMTFDVRSGVDHFMRQAENELRDEELTALRKELSGTADEIRSTVNDTKNDLHHVAGELDQGVKEEIEATKKLVENDPNHQSAGTVSDGSTHPTSNPSNQSPSSSDGNRKAITDNSHADQAQFGNPTPYAAPSGVGSGNKFETPLDIEEKNKAGS